MEYVSRDGRFKVTYVYPDEIDSNEGVMERRERALQRHFGDKPVVYPPWPPEDDVPDYEV